MDEFSLKDRVAIVTGSGRGIGAEIARTLAGAGAAVVVTARTESEVEAVAKEIESAGGTAMPYATDVRDIENLPGLVEAVVKEFSGIDVVVNNAGGGFEWQPFFDMEVEQLEEAFHFTVASPFRLCQLAAPHLLKRPGVSIVNIVSMTVGKSLRGHLIYECAKAALTQLTKSLAADLGPKIRVNGVNPGAIETPFISEFLDGAPDLRAAMVERTRLRRNGTPRDVASGVLYLASPASSFVTGAMLDVAGGPVDEYRAMFPDL
jgi:NAD(P)-dependent dehydrogenase (short-subunit alcohol dehydrogenase family)